MNYYDKLLRFLFQRKRGEEIMREIDTNNNKNSYAEPNKSSKFK